MLHVDAGRYTPYNKTLFGPAPPPSEEYARLLQVLSNEAFTGEEDLACSCVSGWCEGYPCQIPPPSDNLIITAGGWEGHASGGAQAWKKSRDTGGCSSCVAWSYEKGRAVVAAGTCGGCGSIGTAGSGPQRAALLLVDGPPLFKSVSCQETSTVAKATYKGNFESHNFPSKAEVMVKVTPLDSNLIEVAASSSDGAGATSNASLDGDGVWLAKDLVLFGAGWGESADPFTALAQQRALIISSDGSTATFQDEGADITKLTRIDDGNGDVDEEGKGGSTSGANRKIGAEKGMAGLLLMFVGLLNHMF